jgi:kumamolisin
MATPRRNHHLEAGETMQHTAQIGQRSLKRSWCGRVGRAAVAALLAIAATDWRPAAIGAESEGYRPAALMRAYNILPLHQHKLLGQGQTISFVEVDGIDQNDLGYFDHTYRLPPADLQVYVPQGTNGQLAPGPETSMDLEYAHAIAPDAKLQVYEVIRSGDFQGYSKHLAEAVQGALDNGATVISLSLRGTGSILCSTFWAKLHLHSTLQSAAQKGVTVFAASGDYGDRACQGSHRVGTVYPASDPYVTAVGGTRLTTNADGSYGGEVAWSGSGGGISKDFSRPDWQTGSSQFGRYRSVPDVAFDADPRSGVPVYVQGQWAIIGGTSLGAPCWAAIWSLANQYHQARTGHALSWANPLLYGLANGAQHGAVFHDVTQGSNGTYQAGPGWDAVTGWGSPNAYNLVAALSQ